MTKIQIVCENSAAHRSGKQRVLAFCHLKEHSTGTRITVEFHYPGRKKRTKSRKPQMSNSLAALRQRSSLPEGACSYAVLNVVDDFPEEEKNLLAGEAELFVPHGSSEEATDRNCGNSVGRALGKTANAITQRMGEVSRFSFQCPECRKANLYVKPETFSVFLLGVAEHGISVLGLEQLNRVVSRT